MKKILALCLIIVLAVTAVTGATLAYFTDDDSETNTFTVGNVEIDLTEPNWEEDLEEGVYPGEVLAKDPIVTNTGKNPCFVRIDVDGLDCLGENLLIKYSTNGTVDALGADWVLHTDGYYYYMKELAVGATTATPLFDSIVIPTALENNNGETDTETATEYNIEVKAYAVQSQGAAIANAANPTVAELAAWFTTCGM